VCGSRLIRRADAQIQEELSRVDWLIGETARWDVTLVSRADARRLVQFYSQQAEWIRAELAGAAVTRVAPPSPVTSVTPVVDVTPQPAGDDVPHEAAKLAPPLDVVEPAPAPTTAHALTEAPEDDPPTPPEAAAPVAHLLEAQPAPTAAARVVEAASSWSRVWKPFLTDSVGWFVGGFLILAGTFWFVADAWAGMTSTVRAATVFGLAAGWTLAFAAWARFLFRREATTPAARMLERLAAAMAPLAPVAMGPASDSPLLFWPLVLGWSAVTTVLMRAPARRVDERGAWPLALASGLTALLMGAAPLLAPLGVHATWLVAVPVALAAWAFSAGPRDGEGATRFLLSAFAWLLLLFSARVEVAIVSTGAPLTLTLLAPMLAAAVASSRWLARPPTKAADALSVLVVMVQVASLVMAIDIFTPRPAFVVTALLGAWTAWSLAKERVSLASARWLPVAYGFAYLAYQRLDQVVPEVVRDWYGQLKASLGYSTAPLPASYGSVYAALFVVGVGVWAWRRAMRAEAMARREGEVLLDTTAVATAISALLADSRPALLATPVLAAVSLLLALGSGRVLLTIGGVVSALCAAAALVFGLDPPVWWGVVSVALAMVSVPALRPHRAPLVAGALVLGVLGLSTALLAGPSLASTLTAGLSAAAVLLVARNTDDAGWLELAWAGPVLAVAVAARWLAPGLEPVVLATTAALGGAATLQGGRWRSARSLVVIAALGAVAWHAMAVDPATWPGVTMLVGAVAIGLVSRTAEGAMRHALEGLALALAVFTLWPEGCFPWPSPLVPQLVAGALVGLASVMSLTRGRSFRWAVLASLALAMALVAMVGPTSERMLLAVVITLAATPALVPAVTLPLAGVVASLFVLLHLSSRELGTGFSIIAVASSLLGLLSRSAFARRWGFNGSSPAWPAIATSAVVLVPALAMDPQLVWAPVGLGLLAPQLWGLASSKRWLHGLSAPLAAWGAVWGVWQGLPALLLVPPVAAVALTFLARPLKRDLAFDRVSLMGAVLGAVGTLAFASAEGVSAWLVVPWCVALLVLPVGALAARLVAIAALVAALPSTSPAVPAVAVLLLVGVGLRHAPGLVGRWLGAASVEWAEWAAMAGAVGLSAATVLREPSSLSHGALVVSLALAGLVLGVLPLLTAALVVAGVALPQLIHSGELALAPWAWPLALLTAALAAVLRLPDVKARADALLERLGRPGEGLASWVWLAGVGLVVLSLPDAQLHWALPALVLVVTPKPVESAAAAFLTAVALALALPLPVAGVLIGVLGAALGWLGALRRGDEAAAGWLHSGWVLAVMSLALSADLHAWGMPVCWVLAAVTGWAVQRAFPATRWVAWSLVWAASHAVLAWAGVTLSTGAPVWLILPWFALASALVAIVPSVRPWVPQHVGLGIAFRALGVFELALGMVACPSGFEREAVAVLAAVGVSVWLGVRDAKDDEPAGVWLATLAATFGFVTARVLWGASPGLPESVAALVLAFLAGVVSSRVQDDRPDVAKALGQVARWWPMLGLLTAPWSSPSSLSVLLVAMAVHYVVLARAEPSKAVASVLAAATFNAAVVVQWLGLGWGEPQYLLIPAGLSGLVLVHVFADELGEVWAARLRALAVGLVYAAAAFRPLALDAPWAFFGCVALCVVGVGAGVALRIRSFVTLGSVFLVTTVVATLVRWGVREPRLGALFLSGLGLAVVAFMVVVTTKKAELLERYKRVRGALERWEG
jgi:hypothetical protein